MPTPGQHWTDSLFDSVYALYETAREYQTSHRATQVAAESVDWDRRNTHKGYIALEGRTLYGRTATRVPHEDALSVLSRLYGAVASEARRHYEEAALLYASGAAWAIKSVQRGDTPPFVAFQVDHWGDAVPHAMDIPGLDTYAEGPALDAAYSAVVRCMNASEYGEELAGRDEVSDHESAEMHRAIDAASGLADAAFAYGLLAQKAVNFVLLEPRRARERELAAARSAEQTAQSSH